MIRAKVAACRALHSDRAAAFAAKTTAMAKAAIINIKAIEAFCMAPERPGDPAHASLAASFVIVFRTTMQTLRRVLPPQSLYRSRWVKKRPSDAFLSGTWLHLVKQSGHRRRHLTVAAAPHGACGPLYWFQWQEALPLLRTRQLGHYLQHHIRGCSG